MRNSVTTMKRAKPEPRRCTGKNRQGKPCGRPPIKGGFVCFKHGGALPNVQAKAKQRLRDMLADAIDPHCALREAARIAYSDIRQLFDENGRLLPIQKWPDDIARAVAGVEVVKRNVYSDDGQVDDVIKLKLWDKTVKLANLMKHLGLLTEKVELSGAVDLVDRLSAARKRLNGDRR